MKRLLLAAVLVVLLAGGYFFRGYFLETTGETRTARPAPAQLVVADVAVQSPTPILVTAIGTVQSIATVMIKSRVDGEIAKVHFEEGQEVKEGDILFTLDDRGVRAQLQQAEANLERDRAQLERFKLEVSRQTELKNRGVASAQKLEDVSTSVAVTEATVRASEATAENARVNLNYTTIRAPITGRTGSVALKRGNVVKGVDTAAAAVPLVTSPSCGRSMSRSRCRAVSRRSSHRHGGGAGAGCRDGAEPSAGPGHRGADFHRQSGGCRNRHDLSQGEIRQ